MPKNKIHRSISTDSVGWLGNSEQFIFLYKEYFENNTFDGVEMIAFKPLHRLRRFIDHLKKHRIETTSFHSQTGDDKQFPLTGRIIMSIVNSLIFDIPNLQKYFKNIDPLAHAPYLKNKETKDKIKILKPNTLWIENHNYGELGVKRAIALIDDYRKYGINAKGMLDLYHYLAHLPTKTIIKDWKKIIKKIKLYSRWFSGIHLPIGSRRDDSLPIEDFTDEMLSHFAKEIIPQIEKLVIENQQQGIGLVTSSTRMLIKQKQRNAVNFSRLKKTGIL